MRRRIRTISFFTVVLFVIATGAGVVLLARQRASAGSKHQPQQFIHAESLPTKSPRESIGDAQAVIGRLRAIALIEDRQLFQDGRLSALEKEFVSLSRSIRCFSLQQTQAVLTIVSQDIKNSNNPNGSKAGHAVIELLYERLGEIQLLAALEWTPDPPLPDTNEAGRRLAVLAGIASTDGPLALATWKDFGFEHSEARIFGGKNPQGIDSIFRNWASHAPQEARLALQPPLSGGFDAFALRGFLRGLPQNTNWHEEATRLEVAELDGNAENAAIATFELTKRWIQDNPNDAIDWFTLHNLKLLDSNPLNRARVEDVLVDWLYKSPEQSRLWLQHNLAEGAISKESVINAIADATSVGELSKSISLISDETVRSAIVEKFALTVPDPFSPDPAQSRLREALALSDLSQAARKRLEQELRYAEGTETRPKVDPFAQ